MVVITIETETGRMVDLLPPTDLPKPTPAQRKRAYAYLQRKLGVDFEGDISK